jgi:class 3 adenylate cyclase
MGHNVLEAANGIDALKLAQSRLPDLILLDVTMPGMSGFDVCARLKSDEQTQGIPVVMLTALSDVDHRVQGLKLGADDYLSKPFNPRELEERVRTRLRSKVETDELRSMQATIRTTFERFVSPSVVEQLLRDPAQVQLGGKLQTVTVLFADLEGFTSISEYTEPVKLLTILNLYHTMMVSMIREHGGTVDKFMGDGVMALYNTPLEQPDHARRAVMTAQHIRWVLGEFHRQFESEYQMQVNFGIHTGLAVVGNVGAPDMMNYTALGDTVNLAARLQGLSSGGQILISNATYDHLRDEVLTRAIGEMKVKGRMESVMTYEVLPLEMT